MPNFYYVQPSDNLSRLATWACSAALVSGYDLTWLYDMRPERPVRANASNAWFSADFLVDTRIDLVGAIAPTLADGVPFRIQASTTSNFAATPLDVSLTGAVNWDDGATLETVGTYKNRWVDLTSKAGYAAGGYRYWRFGATANTLATFSIADLWLSSYRPGFTFGPQWGGARAFKRAVVTHETEHGVRLRYDRGVLRREFDFNFLLPGDDGGLGSLQWWWMNCQGSARPSLIVPDDTEEECYVAVFADNRLPWTRKSRGLHEAGFSMVELPTSLMVV